MTELTTWSGEQSAAVDIARPVPIDYQTKAVQRLGEWVHAADSAYTVASRLVESSFVPAQFRGKPVEATAAILAGSEVGLSPMASLRAFDVIQGQAAPRAITLRAIVQSYGHEIVLRESTATRCIVEGRRRGSQEWQRSVWTIDRAKDLALTGKDNWKKQPGAMLVARATSEIARLIASDAILGIGYTAEEIADGATGEPVDFAPSAAPADEPSEQATPTRRMSRRPARTEPDDPQISDAQQRKLFALFREKGIPESEQLPGIAHVIGRPIESRTAMTPDEFEAVVTQLEARPDALAQDAREGGEQE